jgi:hypothetical protein
MILPPHYVPLYNVATYQIEMLLVPQAATYQITTYILLAKQILLSSQNCKSS